MPAGRPTLLTPELAHKLYNMLRHGVPLRVAPVACGISYETMRLWRQPCELPESDDHEHGPRCMHLVERMRWIGKPGEEGELKGTGEFIEFSALVTEAVAECEASLAMYFYQGAPRDWKAGEAFLRRRYSERWNAPERVELSGADGGPIQVADGRKQLMDRVREARARLQDMEVIAKS